MNESEVHRLLESLLEQVVCYDREMTIRWANRAACDSVGIATDEIAGRKCHELWADSGQPCSDCPVLRAMDTGEVQEVEKTTPDGRAWFIRGYPLMDERGEVAGAVELVLDITQRRLAEEAYHAVVDHSLQGLVIIQEMQVVFANQAMADISGYSVAEMLQVSPQQLRDFVHPDDQEFIWGHHQARLEGQSLPPRYRFRAVRKDGMIRWLEISTSRIEYQGRPAVQAAYVDVTEQMEAEESLRQSEARNRALLDAMPDLMFRFDAQGTLLGYHAGEQASYCGVPEVLLGASVRDLLPTEVAEAVLEQRRMGSDGGAVQTIEYQLSTPQSGVRDLECRLIACGDEEVLAIVRDVSDRRRAERLVELQRDVAVRLSSLSDMKEGLEYCLELAVASSQMDCGGIYAVDDNTGAFELRAHQGLSADFVNAASYHPADSRCAHIAMQGHPIYTTNEALGLPLGAIERREGLRGFAIIPIRNEERVVACMNVASRSVDEIPAWSRATLETIAGQMGSAISRLKAREALWRAEREKTAILEAMSEIVTYQDTNRRVIWANHSANEVLGMSTKEIVGQRCHELWYGRGEPCAECPVREAIATGHAISCERPGLGETTWQVRAEPVRDNTGRVIGVVELADDITQRKHAERRLRALEDVVNRSPVLVLVWRVAPGRWPVEFVSSNVERVLGYTADELTSGHISWPDITHPDDVPRLEAEVAQYLARGQCEWSQAYRLITKSGQVRWFEDQNLALCDEDGQVTRIQSIVVDVTERKQAERALKESEEKFKNLAEQSPNMIFINQKGRVVYANVRCEEVMGYSREEFGAPEFDFLTLIAPESRSAIEDNFRRHMGGADVSPLEYQLLTREGRRIDAILATKLIRYEGAPAILGIVTDISERKQAERRLQESENRLLATIDSLPFDFFLMDEDGRYAMQNAVSREHWGDLAGKRPEDVYPDERTLALWRDNNRRAFAGEVVRGDVVLAPHGEQGYYHNIISPIWEGDEIRGILGLNIDITERKRAENALRYRTEFEAVVADVSNLFVSLSADEIDNGIDRTLERIGRFAEADRSFVHMLSDDGTRMSMAHEWCAEGIDSAREKMQRVPLEKYPWGTDQLASAALLNLPSVADLREQEAEAKELLQAAGVQSFLSVPIVISGRLIGFLGFSTIRRQRVWSSNDISLTRMVAEVCANALERRQSAEALNDRLAFETLLSHLSAAFVNLPIEDMDAEIEGWLGRIGGLLQIDRATVVQMASDAEDIKVTHAWAAEGLQHAPTLLPRDKFAWFLEQLGKGEILAISRVEDAPEGSAAERQYCLDQGMKSVVVIPVMTGESTLGAVVFGSMREQRDWSDALVQRLRLVGEIFANALLRKRGEQALRREHSLVSRIMETSPAGIVRVNGDGRITFANPCAERILRLTKDEITQRTCNAEQWRITDYAGQPLPDEELPFARVMRTGQPVYDVRHAIAAPDGSRTLMRINASPLFDESGQTDGMVATIEDVTEVVKAEESLRASEERFRNIFENAVLGLYQTTPDGRILMANPALVQMLGYSCFEDLAALNVEEAGYQCGHARQDFKTRIEAGGQVIGLESAWRKRDGTTVIVRENARAVRDERGRTVYYEGTVEDITEWKRTEQALRESERKYREFYEGSRDGSAAVDTEGRITACNSVFLDMLGYTKDEIRELTYEDITPPQWHALEKHILDSQVLVRGYSDVYEKEYVRKGGQIIPVELRTYLDRDRDSQPVGMWAFVRDISERKKAEVALRASERNYREIFNAANEAILVHDPATGVILDVNATTICMLGHSREEILRRNVGDLSARVPAYSQQESVARIAKAAQEGPQLFEWHMRRKDGTLLWVEVNLKSAVIGGQRRVLAVIRDITDRKRAEEAAQQHLAELTRAWHANTLGEMASGLAHELNQPLCAILNYSNSCLRMTRRPTFSVAVVSNSIEEIAGQAERAADIVKHIRALVAKRDPQRIELDLNNVVRDAMDMVRSEAAKRNAVIISRLVQDLPVVEGSAVELEQVVLNLLRNALEAMNEASRTERTLTVSTSVRRGRELQVAVSDTGSGFSPELSEKIFDSFFTTKEQGLGVGLSLSRRIIAAYGGRLWAESDGVSGATFIFTLPLEGVDRGR